MTEEKEWNDLKLPKLTVIPWLIWALLLVAIIGALYAGKVFAEPIAAANAGGVTITVYKEKCTHVDSITNLPNRATWKEDGKVYDGCVGVIPQLGVAMFWFSDKTIAVVPLDMFQAVTGV